MYSIITTNLLKKYLKRFSVKCFIVVVIVVSGCHTLAAQDPWIGLNAVLQQIKAPVFPQKDFIVTKYGAVANGTTSNTAAFKKAIEDCNKAGGGRVVIPRGVYLCGPIYLKSNVNLHVEKGAKIIFSTNPNDYLPVVYTRWEGVELMNYSPLIYAFEEKNIAITGEGILDGQASDSKWWPWKGGKGWVKGTPNQFDEDKRPALFAMAEKGIPAKDRKFGKGFYLRPQFVQPYRCENLLIEGVTFTNSPMWNLTPVLCKNITIQKVTIEGHGPNTDGIDPESCKNMLIKDCFFNTGDDCIAIKSGRNRDGRTINVPTENLVIQGCNMANGHGGIAIGSETSGGVKNVFAEDCKMNSPFLDVAIRIKTSAERGGTTENIYVRNIDVGQVAKQVIIITMNYKNETGPYVPVIRNIEVSNLKALKGGDTGILLEGNQQSPIDNLRLKNVNISGSKEAYKFTHASNVHFENVTINGKKIIL